MKRVGPYIEMGVVQLTNWREGSWILSGSSRIGFIGDGGELEFEMENGTGEGELH